MLSKEVCAMSGKRYLLDTNAVVALLQGNNKLRKVCVRITPRLKLSQSAEWIGISVITQIEFLAFSGLSNEDKRLFSQFLQRIDVIELTPKQNELIDLIIKLRQQYRVKLPDAIIAATAIRYEASLVTADKQLQKIQELDAVDFM